MAEEVGGWSDPEGKKKPNLGRDSASSRTISFVPPRTQLLLSQLAGYNRQVYRRKPDQGVDDTGYDSQLPEDGGNQIKLKDTDQSPVKSADDHQNESDPVQSIEFVQQNSPPSESSA